MDKDGNTIETRKFEEEIKMTSFESDSFMVRTRSLALDAIYKKLKGKNSADRRDRITGLVKSRMRLKSGMDPATEYKDWKKHFEILRGAIEADLEKKFPREDDKKQKRIPEMLGAKDVKKIEDEVETKKKVLEKPAKKGFLQRLN